MGRDKAWLTSCASGTQESLQFVIAVEESDEVNAIRRLAHKYVAWKSPELIVEVVWGDAAWVPAWQKETCATVRPRSPIREHGTEPVGADGVRCHTALHDVSTMCAQELRTLGLVQQALRVLFGVRREHRLR